MTIKRWAAKRDDNEPQIVSALRRAGCLVHLIDVPDLFVQTPDGRHWGLEVKTDDGTLTARQKTMKRNGWRIPIVRTPEEALRAIQLLKGSR